MIKKTLTTLFLFLTLTTFAEEFEYIWDEEIPPPFYPFSISAGYLNIQPADFRTPDVKGQDFTYWQGDAAFAYTHPCCDVWGLIFGVGWVGVDLDWKENPAFHETRFDYVNFSLGAFTNSFPDWTWSLTLATFLDVQELSLIDYALYQGILWGKYNWWSCVELDFGIIVEVGLKKEKVWPILGFIYRPCDTFRINAIYPINVSIEYDIFSKLTIAGAFRFLRNRHRVAQDEPLSQGIFEYHTTGVEGDLIFSPCAWLSVRGFAGSTLDGDLKISNRKDKDSTHYKFEGSLYAGVNAVLSY